MVQRFPHVFLGQPCAVGFLALAVVAALRHALCPNSAKSGLESHAYLRYAAFPAHGRPHRLYLRLGPIFQRPRPTQPDSPIFHLVHAVQNYRGGHYGFPSCHASNAFATATLSALYFRAWRLSVAMFVWALLLCLSRMYLGVHYPGDILLGATVGVAIAFTTYAAAHPLLRPRPNYTKVAFWPPAVIGLLLFSFIIQACL